MAPTGWTPPSDSSHRMARGYQESADDHLRSTLIKDIVIGAGVGLILGILLWLMFSRVCLQIGAADQMEGRVYKACLERGGLNWSHIQWYIGGGLAIPGVVTLYFLRRWRRRQMEDDQPVALYH